MPASDIVAGALDTDVFADRLLANLPPNGATFTNQHSGAAPSQLNFGYSGGGLTISILFDRPGPPLPTPPNGVLSALWDLDVRTVATAQSALAQIDPLIEFATEAAAYYGSIGKRLEMLQGLARNLTDALKGGVGALIDADMEEASARLSAAQAAQALARESLLIANDRPRQLLTLFGGPGA